MIRNGKLASYWIRLSGLGYFIKRVIKQKSYVYPNFEAIKIHFTNFSYTAILKVFGNFNYKSHSFL